MVANLRDRTEVERFLRDADADDLLAERGRIQQLMASAASEPLFGELMARIAYELRFRIPQPI